MLLITLVNNDGDDDSTVRESIMDVFSLLLKLISEKIAVTNLLQSEQLASISIISGYFLELSIISTLFECLIRLSNLLLF